MFIKEPWFWRGFQSAVFYYISCAPCTKIAYRRKRRKESQKSKAEKARALAEQGPAMAYPEHPLPSGTNPYWKEEMLLGPGPPAKRRKKEDEGRLIEMQPGGSGIGSSSESKGTSTDTMEGGHASLEIPTEARDNEPGWNRRRYQREDEILWGMDDTASQSSGMPQFSQSSSHGRQYFARNPAVNDLHPPVVSTAPISRIETQWMLQPPPPAKIMEGRERDNRSRSASGASHRSGASSLRKGAVEPGLARQLSERLVETKLKHGDPAVPSVLSNRSMTRSRGSSNQSRGSGVPMARTSTVTTQGQRHDIDQENAVHVKASSEFLQLPEPQRKRTTTPPPPISIDTELGTSSTRPPLSTILSTSLVSRQGEFPEGIKSPERQEQNPSFLLSPGNVSKHVSARNSASSLSVLQDLDPNPQIRFQESQKHSPDADPSKQYDPNLDENGNDRFYHPLPECDSWAPQRQGWGIAPSVLQHVPLPPLLSASISVVKKPTPQSNVDAALDSELEFAGRDISNLAVRSRNVTAKGGDSNVGTRVENVPQRWSMDI